MKIGNKYIVQYFVNTKRSISMAWKTLYKNIEEANAFTNVATQTILTLNDTYI